MSYSTPVWGKKWYVNKKRESGNITVHLTDSPIYTSNNHSHKTLPARVLNVQMERTPLITHHLYESELVRLRSYTYFPKCLAHLKHVLAHYGFFYENIGDVVTCWICGCRMSGWSSYFEAVWPFLNHVLNNPICDGLRLVKRTNQILKFMARHEFTLETSVFEQFLTNTAGATDSEIRQFHNFKNNFRQKLSVPFQINVPTSHINMSINNDGHSPLDPTRPLTPTPSTASLTVQHDESGSSSSTPPGFSSSISSTTAPRNSPETASTSTDNHADLRILSEVSTSLSNYNCIVDRRCCVKCKIRLSDVVLLPCCHLCYCGKCFLSPTTKKRGTPCTLCSRPHYGHIFVAN